MTKSWQREEAQIKSLAGSTQSIALTPEQAYDLNVRLYDEYLAFRFDSAFHYINLNLKSPWLPSDPERYAISAIRMAHILSVSGIFNNARLLLHSIN